MEQNFEMGGTDWAAFKSSGSIEFPNLPFIIDGDVKVTETFAVHRYIACKYKPELVGTTPAEQARHLQLYSIGNERIMDFVKLVFAEGTTREALSAKALSGLETGLGGLLNDDRQFVNGANLSIADFVLFEHIEYANQISKGQAETTYQKFPKLEAYRNRIAALPGLAEYLATPAHAERAAVYFPPFAKVQGINE